MDQNNIEYKISVMQAFKEGKQIQFKQLDDPEGSWFDHTNPGWNWNSFDYRVKPDEKTEYQKEVEQAFHKGLTIQFKHKTQTKNRWTVCFGPSWDWDLWSYRVLPSRTHLYQWAYKFDGLWRIHNVFAGGNIEDIKEELKRVLFSNSLKGVEDYKRLDYTKIIVDEE